MVFVTSTDTARKFHGILKKTVGFVWGFFLDIFVHIFILRKFRKHRKALESKNLIIFIIFGVFFFPIWVFLKNWPHTELLHLFSFNVIILTVMPSIKMLSEAGKKKSESPVQPSEDLRQCGHFNSRLLASRTVREHISATLSQQQK